MAPAKQAPNSKQYVFIESGPQPPDVQKTIRRHVMGEFIRQRRVRLQEGLRPATSLPFSWKSSNLETADDAISPQSWRTQGQILRTLRQRRAPNKTPDDQFLALFQSPVVGGHGELSPCVCPTPDFVRLGDIGTVVDRGTPSYPQKSQSIYSAVGICRSCGHQLIWSEAAASSVDRQVSRFEANVPDPFAVYPIQKAPHMHKLIHHCE